MSKVKSKIKNIPKITVKLIKVKKLIFYRFNNVIIITRQIPFLIKMQVYYTEALVKVFSHI